ncbi:DUF1516 family protein [Aneurinibacillus aneurinilyticus]|uniref:DUF1516 family protein n=1 Tax=Aneurinibacillus aneurinilyticus TaxID=1391 RepID=UPI002E238B8E|nr:DUF1516 family protein [Aneurinibacillus aneurinilyticus]
MSPNVVTILQRIHTDSWFWILLFFVLSFLLLKAGKKTAKKIAHMLLRLIALIMIITGILMLVAYQFPIAYTLKGILAIAMFGVMEMILGMAARGKRTGPFWGVLIILVALVLLIAFRVLTF